jgi:hypothetical protein
MPDTTPVDRLYEEAMAVIQVLKSTGEVSLEISASDQFRKALLLAAASFFEKKICDSVLDFVREQTSGSPLIENFVRAKAIARQYHTLFDWDASNANKFFGLFGEDFKILMTQRVRQSTDIQEAVKAFLEVGSERNKLVHQDYASFPLEKTLEEIYDLYKKAQTFADLFPMCFGLRTNSR